MKERNTRESLPIEALCSIVMLSGHTETNQNAVSVSQHASDDSN